MKKFLGAVVVLLVVVLPAAAGDPEFTRFSSNPLGPLNVVTIALSEDADTAKNVIENLYKKQMRLNITFPVLIDPTYKQVRSQKAFDISFGGKSATGRKFDSAVDTALALDSNNVTLLLLDRQGKVRAFTQTVAMDVDTFGKVAEELLLNIDGKEIITADSGEVTDPVGWQTDLAKENAARKKGGGVVIDFGASKAIWYKYLGQTLPEVKLLKQDKTETTLAEAIKGKPSAVLIFAASSEPSMMMVAPGIASLMMVTEGLYRSFTLKQAKPGKKFVENAKPDVP